ncbi:hypothetical protein AAEU42_04285 [Pseudoflavonifractor phocaeensis]|uniref:hypothetical protein n=1 Tax=Pseudoflavonifractor phocaeensis TaxID=1870988 RepID=UPI00313B4D93
MWLSRQRQVPRRGVAALTGPVTVPGDPAGAWLEGERRGVAVYAPGGYHWVPAAGQEVLVLKAGGEGEKPCALGAAQDSGELGLRPGEVALTVGKAAVRLTLEGSVEVTGLLKVNGTVVGPQPEREEG